MKAKSVDERALEMAEICHLLTFRRLPVECDMAEAFCPVRKPCNECNEYFNSLPLRTRIQFEVPRRWGLLLAFGWRAAVRGIATDEEFKERKRKEKR